jgi:uncharacterized phage-like protein YoqJ
MNQLRSACFSGHRPQKLKQIDWVTKQIRTAIEHAVLSGVQVFYSGMAQGVDIIAGEQVLLLKQKYPNIRLVAVVPFPKQAYYWENEWITRYNRLLGKADERICLEHTYSDGVFFRRNRYLVEQSDLLIAVCRQGDHQSGTAYTIRYAKKRGIPVDLISL